VVSARPPGQDTPDGVIVERLARISKAPDRLTPAASLVTAVHVQGDDSLRGASRVGLNLKVAIIGTPEELGVVPNLFGHPQAYAQFLDREISFNRPQPLLVVMPAGFGVVQAGPPAALAGMSVDTRHRSYGLTRSAILAVVALARARGRLIVTPAIPPYSTDGDGTPALLVFGVTAALLILGGLVAMRGGKARRSQKGRDN
jgi:hypothetical protein